MPLITETPVAVVSANTWQVRGFDARLSDDGQAMNIALAVGYTDGSSTTWLREDYIAVDAAALATAMAGPPVGATIYDVLKAALYGYLQASGHIPAEATEA